MKVYLDSVGCRLNQSEIEAIGGRFLAEGCEIVPNASGAELAVINTCAVTAAAASDSRQKIRGATRAGAAGVVITGCWATLFPKEALDLPGVSQVIPNPRKDQLVRIVLDQESQDLSDQEPIERVPLPGARFRTRAFIKVQDGCNHHCTFCITTIARGESRSRPIEPILEDIRRAADSRPSEGEATKEFVLTGVHLGSWGQDFERPLHLRDLIEAILSYTSAPRLRLSSLEPWDLDESFFGLWENPRLCRHLHLPLQSGSSATLRRMARRTTPASFAGLIAAARSAQPEMAITTDLIAGFPGETETEFRETAAFVKQLRFAGGHVFTYSARPGTAAARMAGQVQHSVRRERNAILRALLDESAQEYQARFVGRTLPVLWESALSLGPQGWTASGLTDNYLRVISTAPRNVWNQITPVLLTALNEKGLEGRLAD